MADGAGSCRRQEELGSRAQRSVFALNQRNGNSFCSTNEEKCVCGWGGVGNVNVDIYIEK